MEQVKATRRLFNIRFDEEGSHVALVGKNQGGAANGHTVLVTKATNKLPTLQQVRGSDTILKALEQVQVTMSMEEFLRKFFDMWYDDAEMLTKLMGFETEYESMRSDTESEPMTHNDYLAEKLGKVSLMKSISEGSLECISEEDYLSIIKYQLTFENNGEIMDKVDMVKKSLLDDATVKLADLTKSLEDTKTELEAANAVIATFKAAETEAKTKSRMDALKAVLPSDSVEATFKSLESLDDESFSTVVKQFSLKVEAGDKSEIFTEKGVDADVEDNTDVDNSLLELIRKSKNTPKGAK